MSKISSKKKIRVNSVKETKIYRRGKKRNTIRKGSGKESSTYKKKISSMCTKDKVILVLFSLFIIVIGAFLVGEYYDNSSKIILQRQLIGQSNEEKAWNFYKAEGFSDEATAGILGNYMRESRINPNVEEKGNSIGYGLAQWSFGRREELAKWTKENGFKVSSLEGQLNFSMYEMNKMKFGTYSLKNFKNLKDIREATKVFEQYYERAGVVALDERVKFANEIYNRQKNK